MAKNKQEGFGIDEEKPMSKQERTGDTKAKRSKRVSSLDVFTPPEDPDPDFKRRTIEQFGTGLRRRNMDGSLEDPTKPKGLDYLKDNAGRGQTNSWDQPKGQRNDLAKEARINTEVANMPQRVGPSAQRMAIKSPFGVGTNAPVPGLQGLPDAPDLTKPNPHGMTYAEMQNFRPALEQVFRNLRAEQPEGRHDPMVTVANPFNDLKPPSTLSQADQYEYGSARPSMIKGPRTQPASPFGPTPASPLVARRMTQLGGPRPHPDLNLPPASPEASSFEGLQARGPKVITGDRPGLLPAIGRTASIGGASLYDTLMNLLWRSGDNSYSATNDVMNWLSKNRLDLQPSS